jgi:hypothetical protein
MTSRQRQSRQSHAAAHPCAVAFIGGVVRFDRIGRSRILAAYLASSRCFCNCDQTTSVCRLLTMQIPTATLMEWGRRPHDYSWQHCPATKKPATFHMSLCPIDH